MIERGRRLSTAQQSDRRKIGQEKDANLPDEAERNEFWILAATLTHKSLGRSDVQYAAKEIHTKMANPTQGSWKRLKKAARYLNGVERVTWAIGHGNTTRRRLTCTWVWIERRGAKRQPTSGGVMINDAVKHWSRTQTACAAHGGS